MKKKWLYSAALGALLIAGNALGITVHDVLSNGFWSTQARGTYETLYDLTDGQNPAKSEKEKEKTEADGARRLISIWTITSPIVDGTHWKQKHWYNGLETDEWRRITKKEKLIATRDKTHKEKTITNAQMTMDMMYRYTSTNLVNNISSTYTVKPLKKDVRPMKPLVIDDWFPREIDRGSMHSQFYGTEETAITNIISDNEVYITRTISQSGFIERFGGYQIKEDASLLRTYNTHITTDADHVYVDQTICENSTNNPLYNQQDAYQTQYVATFKKGQWKSSTETITQVSNKQAANWYINYTKSQQTTQVSSHQPDHWTMNQRPRQNSR